MKIKTNRVLHKPDFKPTQRFTCDLKNPPKELPPLRDGKGNIVLAPVLCKIVAGSFSGGFIEGKTVDGTRKWSSSYGSGFYFSRLADNSKYSIRHVDCADNDLFIDPDDYEQEPAPKKAERVPFDFSKFISNKETPVETRDGRPAKIVGVPLPDAGDLDGGHPIRAVIEGDDLAPTTFTLHGRWAPDPKDEHIRDLFFVNPPVKPERIQFDVTKFISNEKTPVETRDNRPVNISSVPTLDAKPSDRHPVCGRISGDVSPSSFSVLGKWHYDLSKDTRHDLFFASPPTDPQPAKKERVQFDVTKFISNEKTPVVDRKGRPAKIVRTDAPAFHCGRPQPVEVQGHVEGYPSTRHYYADGRYHVGIDGTDLFFA